MKRLILAVTVATFAGLGQIATAGSLTETTIVEDTTTNSSGAGTVLAILTLAVIVAASD